MENAHPENDRKTTHRKMTEKTHPENERIENAQHGKWQKMYTPENDREVTTGKWKNGKCTPRKRQKNHTLKMTEKAQLEYERMENALHGKWKKMRTKKMIRKVTPGKWQNGKCTPGKW